MKDCIVFHDLYEFYGFDKLEFFGQIFTAPLPPAFMRGVPEGRGEYRTRMRKSFYLRRFALILG